MIHFDHSNNISKKTLVRNEIFRLFGNALLTTLTYPSKKFLFFLRKPRIKICIYIVLNLTKLV